MERELRALYLRWLAGVPKHQNDLAAYINEFQQDSVALIAKLGGQAASLGALADFPVPKMLELSPRAGVVYDEMKQAAIRASIAAGLNARDVARQMLHAGLDKSYRRLERLARTETVSAYWKNQWDSTADLPLIVMVWGSEESKRTCDYCLSREGLVVEDPNIRDHPNGRCTLIPTLRSQVKYKGTLMPDGSVVMDPKWTKTKEDLSALPIKDIIARHDAANTKLTEIVRSNPGVNITELRTLPEYIKADNERFELRALILKDKEAKAAKAAQAKAAKLAREAEAARKATEAARKAAASVPASGVAGSIEGGRAVQLLPRLARTPKDLKAAVAKGGANPKNKTWMKRNNINGFTNEDYGINCTRVANAVEMRRRGFDVKAAPAGKAADKTDKWITNNWIDPNSGKAPNLTYASNPKTLIDAMSAEPDGARFQVIGPWKGGGAHIWNAEKIDGKVVFVEGQVYNASADVTARYLRDLEFDKYAYTPHSVRFFRVDNLRPAPTIVRAFEK